MILFFVFKQKTAYEMRISDWSSDVCSSDLIYTDAQSRRPQGNLSQNEAVGKPVGRVEGAVIIEAARLAPLAKQSATEFRAAVDIRPIGQIDTANMGRPVVAVAKLLASARAVDRKSTRLNSSH